MRGCVVQLQCKESCGWFPGGSAEARGPGSRPSCASSHLEQGCEAGLVAELRVQVVVFLQGLLLVALEALLEDVDAEHGLLAGTLVLLLLRARELVAVALEVGLPLRERRGFLVVPGLDRVRPLDEAVLQGLQAALADGLGLGIAHDAATLGQEGAQVVMLDSLLLLLLLVVLLLGVAHHVVVRHQQEDVLLLALPRPHDLLDLPLHVPD